MATDSLLNLYANSPAVVAAGTTTGAAKPLGRNRSFYAVARVGGDVSAGATLTFIIEQSANGTSGWTTIAGPSANVAEMVGYVGATTGARPEVPSVVPTQDPVRLPFTTTQDYVRTTLTAVGAGATYPNLSVYVEPINGAATKMSGRS